MSPSAKRRCRMAACVVFAAAAVAAGLHAYRGRRPAGRGESALHRLAADLHDGVGARLNTLLAALDPGDPAQRPMCLALHDCLLELQMAVDDIDVFEGDAVPQRLGRLRHRMQPALDRLGIRLDWSVSADGLGVDGERAREVGRIAQEALSNVLRHAQASRVALRWGADARGRPTLQVVDDGIGLAAAGSAAQGHGLGGMGRRARRIGGELQVLPLPPRGTAVLFRLPAAS